MDKRMTGILDQRVQIDRRRMLRTGGALAGAAALLKAPGVAAARQSLDTLELDMACDGRTFRLLSQAAEPALPMVGDNFIVFGSFYPAGTIDEGLTGPDQEGAIGRWICRGTFIVDAAEASGEEPTVITTVLVALGDGLSSTTGNLQTAPDAIVTEGIEPEDGVEVYRVVVGGYGQYAGVRGEQHQVVRGTNDTLITLTPEVEIPAPNFTFSFTFS